MTRPWLDHRHTAAGIASAIGIVLAISCHAGSSTPSDGALVNRSPPAGSLLDRARAYERGQGVARDYHQAATLYRFACNRGQGDLRSCRHLIRAQFNGRGIARDLTAARALAAQICVDQRDPFSCAVVDRLTPDSDGPALASASDVIREVVDHMHACDAAHASECEAMIDLYTGNFVPRLSSRAYEDHLEHDLCTIGILTGCAAELEIYPHNPERPEADPTAAATRLQTACDAGDADACEEAPDRDGVPVDQLCAAHDYRACAILGCSGDAAAGELAARHGITEGACASLRVTLPRALLVSNVRAALVRLNALADTVCACHDAACVRRAYTDSDWTATAHLAGLTTNPVPQQLAAEFEATEQRLATCANKQMVPTSRTPPP
jgi:hypothetical protein